MTQRMEAVRRGTVASEHIVRLLDEEEGEPVRALFDEVVGTVVRRLAVRPLRVAGEMVELLAPDHLGSWLLQANAHRQP